MMNKIIYWFYLLLMVFSSTTAFATRLLSVEIKQRAEHPSIFFKLDKPANHKVFTLTNPNRVVIDFENTDLAVNLRQINVGQRLIKAIRTGHPNPGTLRLVFEINQHVTTQTDSMYPVAATKQGFLLGFTINLLPPEQMTAKSGIPIEPRDKPGRPVIARHAPRNSLRDVVIVLDPGHGGKDPGASGPKHAQEKNVTLAIALKLKQIIDKQPGMHAVLTRNGDYYIELRERLNIARKYNGDVFVSIHADAFNNHESNGASVFALSQSGATSEAARWLAAKENYSELGGVNLSELDDQSGLVRTVLIDLSQTATIGSSLHMGERVLHHLDRVTSLHNHKVEQARFMVLKSPDIPSILIETGFISNPREERNLTSSSYQTYLTQAIFQGLKGYFWDYPPHGTRIEALVGNDKHLVRQGKLFQTIAARSN